MRPFARALSTSARRPVYVIGVGMTKFNKPGTSGMDYPALVKAAGQAALADASVTLDDVEQFTAGYVYGDSTSGTRAVYELGFTGKPIYNVNSNCSTGSSALMLAQQLIAGGLAECTMAVGFEKMQMGSLSFNNSDREGPIDHFMTGMSKLRGGEAPGKVPGAPWLFGAAGRYHSEKYGTKPEHFAKIAYKNHKHSVNNPYAQFQKEYTLDEILASKPIYAPLTMLQCSPTSDGAGAAVLASEEFVKRNKLESKAVEIVAQSMATDTSTSFDDPMACVGTDMTKRAAAEVFKKSGLSPRDVDVIELHDCFSTNELLTYEGLGLCGAGEGGSLVDSGDVTYGGRWVVNPSGLISKGHPLGATGLAQCAELCWQLRGEAGKRQVADAKVGLQHNLGLGGAAIVTLYRKA